MPCRCDVLARPDELGRTQLPSALTWRALPNRGQRGERARSRPGGWPAPCTTPVRTAGPVRGPRLVRLSCRAARGAVREWSFICRGGVVASISAPAPARCAVYAFYARLTLKTFAQPTPTTHNFWQRQDGARDLQRGSSLELLAATPYLNQGPQCSPAPGRCCGSS